MGELTVTPKQQGSSLECSQEDLGLHIGLSATLVLEGVVSIVSMLLKAQSASCIPHQLDS